jgi:urease gamma subunit
METKRRKRVRRFGSDNGEVASVLVIGASTLGVGSLVLVAKDAAVVAVSDNTANNANFVLALLGIISIMLTAATWLNRRWNRALEDRIKEAISTATKPIQPDANGGKSLADLHKKVDDGFAHANIRIDHAEARQLGIQEQLRDVSEMQEKVSRRLDEGIEQSREIFAVAEQNRLAAEAYGIEGLVPLPHDPQATPEG